MRLVFTCIFPQKFVSRLVWGSAVPHPRQRRTVRLWGYSAPYQREHRNSVITFLRYFLPTAGRKSSSSVKLSMPLFVQSLWKTVHGRKSDSAVTGICNESKRTRFKTQRFPAKRLPGFVCNLIQHFYFTLFRGTCQAVLRKIHI